MILVQIRTSVMDFIYRALLPLLLSHNAILMSRRRQTKVKLHRAEYDYLPVLK
jgi:hypothetical protein